MTRVPLNVPPGLNTGDTSFSAKVGQAYYTLRAGWRDMDKARFWRERPQTIGGWQNFTGSLLTGVCRCVFPWNDLTGTLNVGFGTHSNLEVFVGGGLYDITPPLALPSAALGADQQAIPSGANPLATTNGSPTVVVTQPGHPYLVGDSNIVSGAVAIGGITPNGTFAVTAVTANTWSYAFGSNATGTVAAGGGAAVVITPQRAFAAGLIDGTGGAGFGTGAFSVGNFSQPSVAAYYPATWSLSNYGQTLVANPRGGAIYQWNNATGTPAAPLANSPPQVSFIKVTPQRQIVAFGCNDEITGIFNPLVIRASDIEGPTQWSTLSSDNCWEQKIEGGGRLVGAEFVGDYIFVWTDTSLFQATYLGNPGQTYQFTKLGDDCGLIGVNAAAVLGQTAYWMSPDGNFWSCALNGEPTLMVSPVQPDVAQNLAFSQQDKIVASVIPSFAEVWWFYPDARDGFENSRYVGVNTITASGINPTWIHGTFVRTAFDGGAPMAYPIGCDYTGNVFLHEIGQTADGAPISWFFESTAQYLGDGDERFQIKGVWPDFQGQVGAISLTLIGRDYPQGNDRVKGPWTLTPNQAQRSLLMDTRLVRVRVAGNASPTFGRLGTLEFEMEPTGAQ